MRLKKMMVGAAAAIALTAGITAAGTVTNAQAAQAYTGWRLEIRLQLPAVHERSFPVA